MEDIMITKIKVNTVYSEEQGEYTADFHYRFEKELNMATDHSTGEPAECYGKVTIHYKEPISEETLSAWHQSKAPLQMERKLTEFELSHIVPISKAEYESSHQ